MLNKNNETSKYVYSGPNNIILSEIIKKSTGQNIAEFAEKYSPW